MTQDVLQYPEMTEKHIAEAVVQAGRYDRLLSNQNGDDAFPMTKRNVRLMSLVLLKLHADLQSFTAQASELDKKVKENTARASAKAKPVKAANAPKKAAALPTNPPLKPEQRRAFDAINTLLQAGEVVTTRRLAELCGWASHNTASKHINTLLDLGYLTKVGKTGVLVLSGKTP